MCASILAPGLRDSLLGSTRVQSGPSRLKSGNVPTCQMPQVSSSDGLKVAKLVKSASRVILTLGESRASAPRRSPVHRNGSSENLPDLPTGQAPSTQVTIL